MVLPLAIGAVVVEVPTTFQTPLSGHFCPVVAVVPIGARCEFVIYLCLYVLGLSPLPIYALKKKNLAVDGKKKKLKSILIMECNYATPPEIQAQLVRANLDGLILKLEAYAYGLIKGMGLSIEAFDIVYDVLLSIQEDGSGRTWDKAKCPQFDRFLFGAVKSHIHNSYKKHKNNKEALNGHVASYQSPSYEMDVLDEIDFDTTKQKAITYLRELGGDAEEECVFECWCDGTDKPQEVAKFLGVPVETVNKATKRLKRKQPLIQERLNYYHP
jgi:DNA-directed RNA polymerase specialized sigma24 family protein